MVICWDSDSAFYIIVILTRKVRLNDVGFLKFYEDWFEDFF